MWIAQTCTVACVLRLCLHPYQPTRWWDSPHGCTPEVWVLCCILHHQCPDCTPPVVRMLCQHQAEIAMIVRRLWHSQTDMVFLYFFSSSLPCFQNLLVIPCLLFSLVVSGIFHSRVISVWANRLSDCAGWSTHMACSPITTLPASVTYGKGSMWAPRMGGIPLACYCLLLLLYQTSVSTLQGREEPRKSRGCRVQAALLEVSESAENKRAGNPNTIVKK